MATWATTLCTPQQPRAYIRVEYHYGTYSSNTVTVRQSSERECSTGQWALQNKVEYSMQYGYVFFFFFFSGWLKVQLKLPHFRVSDTCRVSI